MKYIIMACITLLGFKQIAAQDFVRELDNKTGKVLLHGRITFEDLLNESTCSWLEKGANAYQPNKEIVDELSKITADYRFVVFAGTWCGDTKDLLPKFYKVLIEAGIDLHAVEMYGVNRKKESLDLEHIPYKIKFVPTIIVMHKDREIGRIVENVNLSIEGDLETIILKDFSELEKERMKRFN